MNATHRATLDSALGNPEIDAEALVAVFSEQMDDGELSPELMAVAHAFHFGSDEAFLVEVHRLRARTQTIPLMCREHSQQWLRRREL